MKLDLVVLRNVEKSCKTTSDTATAQFQELNRILGEISSNVQSGELKAANDKLIASITNLSSRLANDLLKVQTFMNEQLNAYEATNEQAKSTLDNVAASITENL